MVVNGRVHRRVATTAMTVGVSLAFVGFFVGTRSTPQLGSSSVRFRHKPAAAAAVNARTGEELSVRPWTGGAEPWTPPAASVEPFDGPAQPQWRQQALAARAKNRAYEGAPPTVPHPVGSDSAEACAVCHEAGAQVAAVKAPPYSHQPYALCTQCHVAQAPGMPWARLAAGAAAVENLANPLRGAVAPYRWADGSPPQIPHSTWMRSRCASCHGAQGAVGLRTSHPERQSCEQCHAPSAVLEQRAMW